MHVFDVFMQGWANGIASRNRNKIIISFKEKHFYSPMASNF